MTRKLCGMIDNSDHIGEDIREELARFINTSPTGKKVNVADLMPRRRQSTVDADMANYAHGLFNRTLHDFGRIEKLSDSLILRMNSLIVDVASGLNIVDYAESTGTDDDMRLVIDKLEQADRIFKEAHEDD